MHFQRLADQKDYGALKSEYIHLNELLGDRESELARLRAECTQQLGFNKEMERQGGQLQAENGRLRSHIRDCQGEQQRTRQLAENLAREAAGKQEGLQKIERNMLTLEDDIKDQERQADALGGDIAERKGALTRARQSAGEIESIIADLKAQIEALRQEESELTDTLERLNKDLTELNDKRHHVSKENDVLKAHAA